MYNRMAGLHMRSREESCTHSCNSARPATSPQNPACGIRCGIRCERTCCDWHKTNGVGFNEWLQSNHLRAVQAQAVASQPLSPRQLEAVAPPLRHSPQNVSIWWDYLERSYRVNINHFLDEHLQYLFAHGRWPFLLYIFSSSCAEKLHCRESCHAALAACTPL